MAIEINKNLVKDARALLNKKGRDAQKRFVVEGDKIICEMPSDWTVCYYLCAESYAKENNLSVLAGRAECIVVRDAIFEGLSDTKTPQGIAAVCEQKFFSFEKIILEDALILFGENLQDPGNVGALIRTAAAAGAAAVLLTNDGCDPYNPKVIRASAGYSLRLPVIVAESSVKSVRFLKENNLKIYAAHLNGNVTPYEVDMKKGCCILVGNEACGLTDEICNEADALLKLPMPGANKSGSLNASVAGGIILYEAVRQRMKKNTGGKQ
ncbi:MAG: RNA methyltransferase [Defluviitaleaceae bacterium]|nr:RNA methyltransferase [Defluviitaleaceae bacterium]